MADFQLHADALLEPKSCMSEDPEVALEDEDRDQEEEEEDQEEEEDMEEGGIRREIRLMKQAGIRDKLELLGKDAEGTTKAIRNVANVHFNAPIQFTVMEKSTAAFNFPDAIAYSKDGLLALNSGALIKVLVRR